MEKSKRGRVLNGNTREIVFNVIQYFDEEKRMKRYYPLEHSHARACMATGLSKSTISKIKREGEQARIEGSRIATPSKGQRGLHNKRVVIDNCLLSGIREIVSVIYDARDIPTLNKIIAMAKNNLNYNGSRTTLCRILKKNLGFIFIKCKQNRRIIMERNNVKASRINYLRHIRENDALGSKRRPVFFLDETWIHTTNKVGGKKIPIQSWLIACAGNESGFLPGTKMVFEAKIKKYFYSCMDKLEFVNYVQEKILPNLPENSIVVIDDASYHNLHVDKVPTFRDPKIEIQEWLNNYDFKVDRNLSKCELLEIIEKNKPPERFLVDDLFNKRGHIVLRLPPFNQDLNPIVYIWDLVKKRFKEKLANSTESQVEQCIHSALNSVTEDEWRNEINEVKRLEEAHWVRDVTQEEDFDNFILGLSPESDVENNSENENGSMLSDSSWKSDTSDEGDEYEEDTETNSVEPSSSHNITKKKKLN
ncbi:uncharacterized protein LOC126975896 [Leptidea sinapis]|uniref:uncharacterized protein LOC126975896 n=1 Tax=Leptidea sinapis TaxID=189913 RepID=UPI0021359FDB|nr:uncharacterized protein LOC126975896 [Leptidea sinapis]XP_050679966.1 uncharacterized protein LOC126975896 [Leptidea sinapis]XP_050679967.1 uncharacterized protein LOC126975896 [Leptidea sinapis]